MASEFYGINRGQLDTLWGSGSDGGGIIFGGATGGTDFEFRIDTGKGSTTKDAKIALEAIIRFLLTRLPAATANIPPI